MDNLVTELASHGYTGTETEKAFAMIGAIDGKGYYGENVDGESFNIEIYKFKDTHDMPIRQHTQMV